MLFCFCSQTLFLCICLQHFHELHPRCVYFKCCHSTFRLDMVVHIWFCPNVHLHVSFNYSDVVHGTFSSSNFLKLIKQQLQNLWLLMLYFQFYYISQNLTTNEILNYKKYQYLHDPMSGKYRNPFNRGIIRNFISYFTCIPSSGTDEYSVIDLNITKM